jgi:hypothetical protein
MKSSAELLRGMKSQVRWLVGILVLSVLWKWLGLPSTAAMKSADNTLFKMVGGRSLFLDSGLLTAQKS